MYRLKKSIFAFLFILTLSVTANARNVTVSGEITGIKVYTDGLVVTGTEEITTSEGKKVNIAKGYGIEVGDIIKKINGSGTVSAKAISDAINSYDTITLTVERKGKAIDISLTPATTHEGKKLGIWLRDSTAGLGTITCIDGDRFIGLGHGICDIDTGDIMPVKNGIIQKCTNIHIMRGENGSPGAIMGEINGKILGNISTNTQKGISGNVKSAANGKEMPIAQASEVRTGEAKIMCNVDGEGVKEYGIEIKRIALPSSHGKDMIIEITDPDLLAKTGGIIQGMSGSPIIQNDKLIGAVTHVFVNNPKRGYGIFIENMLAEAEKG